MIHLTPQISIGSIVDAFNEEAIHSWGFKVLLVCTPTLLDHGYSNIITVRIPVPDTVPWTDVQKSQAVHSIRDGVELGRVLVCSDGSHGLGVSSALAGVYFYLLAEGMSSEKALQWLKTKYPKETPHPNVISGKSRPVKISHPPSAPLGLEVSELSPTSPPEHVNEQPSLPELPLSIVTVTMNRKALVQRSISSILRHTPPPYELIVVDNGSSDGTVDYLLTLKDKISVIQLGQNFGKGKAANLAFGIATGTHIAYFDSDIVVPKGWLQEVRPAYEAIPNVGWLSLSYQGIPYNKETLRRYGEITLAEYGGIGGGMVFLSRARLLQLGGYVEDRLYGLIDIEYTERARAKGLEVGYLVSEVRLDHLGNRYDTKEYQIWKSKQKRNPTVPGPINI